MNPFYLALDLAVSFVQGFPAWAVDHLRWPGVVFAVVGFGIYFVAFVAGSKAKQEKREAARFDALQRHHQEPV